jgi:prepilin-type N-terminal cleavage/methylation domain-containing protein
MTSLKSRSGFTLLELLIVVSVISILAAIAAAGFGSSLNEGKASDLAEDLVRIGRVARARPLGTGMAHRLVYLKHPDNGLGVLRLDEGDSNSCNLVSQNGWVPIEAVNAIEFTGGDRSAPPPSGKQVVDFRPTISTLQTIQLCFEPSGATLLRVTAEGEENPSPDTDDSRFTDGIVTGGVDVYDVVFQVDRTVDGSGPEGVVRAVRFPFGGSARIQR